MNEVGLIDGKHFCEDVAVKQLSSSFLSASYFFFFFFPFFSILPYNTLMLNMRGKKTLVSFPSDSRNPPVSYFFILDHIIFRRREKIKKFETSEEKRKTKNENSLNIRNPTVQSTSPSLSFSAFVNALSL
jgi:hypothetical protein